MRRFILLSVIFGMVVVISCDFQRDAIGEPDAMIVIADSVDWEQTQSLIQETFAPEVPTPRPEPWYDIQYVTPDKFTNFMIYRNIIILSLLREGSPSMRFINRRFSSSLVEKMQAGNLPVAKKEDPWRDNQMLLILTATSREQLATVLQERSEELRGYFDEMFIQRQREYLYGRYEQKGMQRRLASTYDWTIRVPRDWIIIHERPEENFFWLGRHLPIRWMSVYWEEFSNPVVLDSALAVDLRRTVGREQYGDVRVNTEYLEAAVTTLNGRRAIKIRGLWEHREEAKGGPFIGYAYYDPEMERLYYLDAQVFAPDMKKLVFLRRLDVILSTFRSGPGLEDTI